MTPDEFVQDLSDKMRTTRGARFMAAERLHKKGKFGIIAITVLSIYITSITITFSIFPQYFAGTTIDILNTVSIISSISVISLSLVEYAGARPVNAEILHRNALAISRLRAQLKAAQASNANFTEFHEISKAYEELNADTKINHSEKDYQRFILSRRMNTPGWRGVWLRFGFLLFLFRYWVSDFWVYIMLLLGLPACVLSQFLFGFLK